MHALVKKLHMYAGLLNLTILMVFGVAGLTATLDPAPQNRKPPGAETEFREFRFPPNLTDLEAADTAYRFLKLPFVPPLPKNAVRRDGENNLSFDVYGVNGRRTVTLLEKESRIRIEARRLSLTHFLNNLHATTSNSRVPDLAFRLWTWYTEFSIWSLIGMSVSGVYLWLASRPGFRWARISFAAGSGVFILLYAITR